MAPVTFPKAMDLSGRTPIYRLTKNNAPPRAQPPPPPPPPVANSQAQSYGSPYHSPYQSPYPSSQSAPEDGPPGSLPRSKQQNLDSDARSSPLSKRRGRKLQENEILILVNCCLEFQCMYAGERIRFWSSVATSLKRQIKRNFSWQSCRQIVDELVAERRERRHDIAAGKSTEQPLTELRLATDKWIAVSDKLDPRPESIVPAPTLKRPGPVNYEQPDPNAGKRPKQQEQMMPPGPPPHMPQAMAPPPIPTPAMMDIQSLRLDLQGLRREMQEMRQELNGKLGLVLQSLQELKELNETKDK